MEITVIIKNCLINSKFTISCKKGDVVFTFFAFYIQN